MGLRNGYTDSIGLLNLSGDDWVVAQMVIEEADRIRKLELEQVLENLKVVVNHGVAKAFGG